MASIFSTVILGALALVLWGGIGRAVSRRLMPPALVWPAAPILGWAMQNALALPLLMLVGFSPWTVAILFAIPFAFSIYDCVRARGPGFFQGWMFALAALVAAAAAIAILPKAASDGILLAAPIYDHAKIAIVDEIARLGVPPGNPFFGENTSSLPYYYLLHFSAAQLASLTGLGGWNADAALTWFTAFAVLLLAMGIATQIAGRFSAIMVALLTLGGSARPLLAYLTGRPEALDPFMSDEAGLSGLLYQVSWAPQHVMSAGCVIAAVIVLAEASVRVPWLAIPTLALLMASSFESSVWVGGPVLALGGLAAAIVILKAHPADVKKILLVGIAAAVAAFAVASPMLIELWKSAGLRGGGFPIALQVFSSVGEWFPDLIGEFADYPAFWLLLLPVDLAPIYVPGVLGVIWFVRRDLPMQPLAHALIALAIVSLCVSWLFASRIGTNNDLGWRAVLPAILVLTVFAAAGIEEWIRQRNGVRLAVTAAFFLLGLPGGIRMITENISGASLTQLVPSQTSQMWREVREVADVNDRVASNPAFLAKATLWPINISWALQADRRSCYAGPEYALAFVPIPPERREEIDAQFTRIFAGQGNAEDIAEIITRYRCRVVLLTPYDGAWANDPFATSALFRSVKSNPQWRIYRASEADRKPVN